MKAFVCGWFIVCCAANLAACEQSIESVAGTGSAENNGDTGPAGTVNIGEPFGVELGPDGGLYITEVRHHRIRRLDLATGVLTTVAGCGRRGYSGDGGLAVNAEINEPYEIRFDENGNMYFVEMKNHVVRVVDRSTKIISTVVGSGRQGFGGDGGSASAALLNQPHSIALDREGAIYVADIGNHRIRRVDPKTRTIESIAGNSERRLPRDGQAARGNSILGPRALCVHGETLWIALREGHSIWRMSLADGILHHVAGTGKAGAGGDGGPAAEATFNGPKGIAIGPDGKVLVADSENNAIRQIDLQTGLITTVVGNRSHDGSAGIGRTRGHGATLNSPHGVCVAADGAIFIGDTLNHRVARAR
jgi:DNA-binding beta-propeller fold protein YncE